MEVTGDPALRGVEFHSHAHPHGVSIGKSHRNGSLSTEREN
jgi:hypothetical protein